MGRLRPPVALLAAAAACLAAAFALTTAAVVVPAWADAPATFTPFGTNATAWVGLWMHGADVPLHRVTIASPINTSDWPLWGDAKCVSYFTGTQAMAVTAAGLLFLALLLAVVALGCALAPQPKRRGLVRALLWGVTALTAIGFAAALIAFALWIVVEGAPCGNASATNGTHDGGGGVAASAVPGNTTTGTEGDGLLTGLPPALHGYRTGFILDVVATAFALAALCLAAAAHGPLLRLFRPEPYDPKAAAKGPDPSPAPTAAARPAASPQPVDDKPPEAAAGHPPPAAATTPYVIPYQPPPLAKPPVPRARPVPPLSPPPPPPPAAPSRAPYPHYSPTFADSPLVPTPVPPDPFYDYDVPPHQLEYIGSTYASGPLEYAPADLNPYGPPPPHAPYVGVPLYGMRPIPHR